MSTAQIKQQTEAIRGGDRRALAKGITLIESSRPDHAGEATALLDALLPHTGRSLRIGISGVPGVGKSTFIERFGLALIEAGHRVAVLAIDPSSTISGGSILGDKTRMEKLATHASAFIRPSPSGGALGGVAARTREAGLLCEAAGFDIVIIETVGVGQSETAVAAMTDVFVLLQLPNAGDELQAMKKGIVELADFIVINKADLDGGAAEQARRQVARILELLHGRSAAWQPEVMTASALDGRGLADLWAAIRRYQAAMQASGEFEKRRHHQALDWMWQIIDHQRQQQFRAHPAVKAAMERVTQRVGNGEISATSGAAELIERAGS
ncbi:MAG: methylmalonyl Co-A mutase-associated GTPase MeaB [Steroidobacteraceae bacterium]